MTLAEIARFTQSHNLRLLGFELDDAVLAADGLQKPCHVVWRKEKRIGVAFD